MIHTMPRRVHDRPLESRISSMKSKRQKGVPKQIRETAATQLTRGMPRKVQVLCGADAQMPHGRLSQG